MAIAIDTSLISAALNMAPIGVIEIDAATNNVGNWGGAGPLNAFYGKKHSDETKELLRIAKTGSKHSESTKQKMSKTRVGHQFITEDGKKRISEALTGIVRDDDFREKCRARQIGKSHSEDTKKKMAAARTGRKLTPEHCAAIKAAWNKRRGITE